MKLSDGSAPSISPAAGLSYGNGARGTQEITGAAMNRDELEGELARQHSDAYAWALRCASGHRADAEDALQAAYLGILEGRIRFEGRSSFRTWLFGVIRRVVLAERRRGWLRWTRLRAWFDRSSATEPIPGAEPDGLPEEAGAALSAALEGLSVRQREVLHLVFYQELTVEEAAGVLGTRVGTARTHYERGKARLRALLGEER